MDMKLQTCSLAPWRRVAGLALSDRFSGYPLQWVWLEFAQQLPKTQSTPYLQLFTLSLRRMPLLLIYMLASLLQVPEKSLLYTKQECRLLIDACQRMFTASLQFSVLVIGFLLAESAVRQSYLAVYFLTLLCVGIYAFTSAFFLQRKVTDEEQMEERVDVEKVAGTLAIALLTSNEYSSIDFTRLPKDLNLRLEALRNSGQQFITPPAELSRDLRFGCFFSTVGGMSPLLIFGLSQVTMTRTICTTLLISLLIWLSQRRRSLSMYFVHSLKWVLLFTIAFIAGSQLQ